MQLKSQNRNCHRKPFEKVLWGRAATLLGRTGSQRAGKSDRRSFRNLNAERTGSEGTGKSDRRSFRNRNAEMLYSEIGKFGVVVTGEQKRANGSGWQKYYVATTEYDKCTQCSLHWGHRGACILDDTLPDKPRGAKVAASANLSSRIGKPKRASSYKKCTEAAGLLLRLRGEELVAQSAPPPSPLAAFPSMKDFLKTCKLNSYTEAMLEKGFDDVEFLAKHERDSDNNLQKILNCGDFPIIKPGHVLKLVFNLRKLPI
jgi:hypothetical protein